MGLQTAAGWRQEAAPLPLHPRLTMASGDHLMGFLPQLRMLAVVEASGWVAAVHLQVQSLLHDLPSVSHSHCSAFIVLRRLFQVPMPLTGSGSYQEQGCTSSISHSSQPQGQGFRAALAYGAYVKRLPSLCVDFWLTGPPGSAADVAPSWTAAKAAPSGHASVSNGASGRLRYNQEQTLQVCSATLPALQYYADHLHILTMPRPPTHPHSL